MRCYNCPNSQFEKIEEVYNCKRKHVCLMEDIQRRNNHESLNIKVGDKIQFKEDVRFWTVVAKDERYLIATRKHLKTYLYTICDLQDCIRGSDDSYTRFNYEKDDLTKCLEQLHNGELGISFRNWVTLDIVRVK